MFGKRSVKVDSELYQRLQAAAALAGYATTEEFIRHALEQAAEKIQDSANQQVVDQQVMDQQLRGLGYLE